MNEYLKILGIQNKENISINEIKKAFRKKAKLLHPDINNSPTAHEDFIKLCEAYEYLVNINTRRKSNQLNQDEIIAQKIKYAREKAKIYAEKEWKEFVKKHEAFRESFLSKILTILNYAGFLLIIITIIDFFLPPLTKQYTLDDIYFNYSEENDIIISFHDSNKKYYIYPKDNFFIFHKNDTVVLELSKIFSMPLNLYIINKDKHHEIKIENSYTFNFPVLTIFLILPLISIFRKNNNYDKIFMNEFLRIVGACTLIGSIILLIL